MNTKLIFFGLVVLLSLGCNSPSPPSPFRQKFEECLTIIGSEFSDGTATVGDTDGKAHLLIYRNVTEEIDEWRVRVNYKVFIPIVSEVSDQYTEDGGLKNFRLEQGKYFGAKQLSADWSPNGSGSGKFSISIIKNRKSEYVVYVGILGATWNYFDNIELDKTTLDKLIVLLEGQPLEAQTATVEPIQNAENSNQVAEKIDTIPYIEDNIVDEFICKTDYLRLRLDSSAKSKVLEYIRINETLYNLHDQSVHSDTITLDGVTTIEPWYYVKSKKGNIGWVNGCCIELTK